MNTPTPFSCEYTPQFAQLIHDLKISLIISTYQAGKAIMISSVEQDKLVQLPRSFPNAMGMAVSKEKIAVSTQHTLEVLENSKALAKDYPQKPGVYDSIFVPRATYHTGYLALHDMFFNKEKIIAVNTMFSCLSYIDDNHSFTPFWKPPFISELAAKDRCHLNGLAMEKDEIKYLTALGKTDEAQGWRENKMNGGIVMEYPSGEIILDGLGMPHSPRVYDGKLYVLNSTQGELIRVNPQTGTYDVVCKLGGFARGMDKIGDYLFIGVSKLRHNSQVFADLPIAKSSFAGVIAVYLPYNSVVGQFKYQMSVDEIYDVKILPGMLRPNVLSPNMEVKARAITIPNAGLWANAEKKGEGEKTQTTQPKQNNETGYNFSFLPNKSGKEILSHFKSNLHPFFAGKLPGSGAEAKFHALTVTQNNQLAGLAVAGMRNNNQAIQIHSLWVHTGHRNKGLGTRMLFTIEDIAKKNNIKVLDFMYHDDWENVNITENLFSNAGWAEPRFAQEVIILDNKTVLQQPWVQKALAMHDENVELFPWPQVSEKEKQEILSWQGQPNGYPPHLNPFRELKLKDTPISHGARVNGKIAGWCIVHWYSDDTVQCSSLFVKEEYRKYKLAERLTAIGFDYYRQENILSTIYQVVYEDKLVRRLLNLWFKENGCIKQKYFVKTIRKRTE